MARFGGALRLNYGAPAGDVWHNQSLAGFAGGQWGLEGDSDFLIIPQLLIGLHAGFGLASQGSDILARLRG